MISIAICDDSSNVLRNLEENIQDYARKNEKEIRTFSFHDGSELIENHIGRFDIIFLDIKMPKMNGIETAKKIRENDSNVIIIFLTSLVQYALEGYDVNAANYLIKPISRKRMEMELDRWVGTLLQKEEPYICFHNDTGNYRILLKNISYIETYNRNLLIHTAEQNIVCYWKMKDMESKIAPYGFSRNYSSYIVNLFYVENIEKNEVKLSTGERLPISKTKKKGFMEDIAEYWGNLI